MKLGPLWRPFFCPVSRGVTHGHPHPAKPLDAQLTRSAPPARLSSGQSSSLAKHEATAGAPLLPASSRLRRGKTVYRLYLKWDLSQRQRAAASLTTEYRERSYGRLATGNRPSASREGCHDRISRMSSSDMPDLRCRWSGAPAMARVCGGGTALGQAGLARVLVVAFRHS